ncbi:MAG TPA: polyphenol oxidase family protein [Candidatus Sulfomarinibacteraceae bacterium]|nr:polyphenol oxidase family protein [Candidatus Sulfomarinibacteraceae bacterium]
MNTVTPPAWQRRGVGLDRALVRVGDGVTMVFGLGPPDSGTSLDQRLSALLAGPDLGLAAVRRCRQVHGRRVHPVDGGGPAIAEVGAGDALVTASPGVGLLVVTADCVPVLMAGGGAAAAVHAGWRGCAADVVGAAVAALGDRWRIDASRLRVALGPAICGACYQVGPEVHAALGRIATDGARWRHGDRVDLRAFLRARFEALGVPAQQIETVGGCTLEDPELASYRRDGARAGRQWSLVALTG